MRAFHHHPGQPGQRRCRRQPVAARGARPLPAIPTSCLYSLGDGVVPPQEATIDGDPALHENIRVPGSHLGLGFNGIVLAVVADRLAQPEGAWQPFRPDGLLGRIWRATSGASGRDATSPAV